MLPLANYFYRKMMLKLRKDGEMKRLKAKGREVRDTAWGADDNNHHLYVWSSQQLANLFASLDTKS